MACTCTFNRQHMHPPYALIRPRSLRVLVPLQTPVDFDLTVNQSIEEARQLWRLGCFDSREVMALEQSRAPFPFLNKKAINEFAHLLRHPDPNTVPFLQHFAVASSTNRSPIYTLPLEITNMVLSHLCDFDALNLALASRQMFNMCGFRLQEMITHRTSGGWIGKRLAAVGEKAYTPGFISYEPMIQECRTGMVVPSRDSETSNILDSLFRGFNTRKVATGKQILETEQEDLGIQPEIRYGRRRRLAGIVASGRYPETINEIVRFLLAGSTKTSGDTTPVGRRSYFIRNLKRRHYIHTIKGESFKRYLRRVASHKRTLEGTDVGRFTAEEAALCAFTMEIMWGGSQKEGEWAATDCFDIVEEGKWDLARARQEGWEDVSDDVVEGAIGAVQGVY
ncbi:uncharacterized protein DFL_000105 [Arthrobotrys flagrans]|uniref:F-box domain-containing protein n=1 Tax=Arthrobotrys flagrans TaxID=97331 RepID=A0A437ACT8_ARTFL|nr:hypothetical protein DFL_000105 [Arthrobotrys flagrans]